MITYLQCPACRSSDIVACLKVTDYTVSKKVFDIWECRTCTLRFTQDVPEQDAIGAYYQSDDYISHTDTREGLVNRLYHLVRKHTLDQKKSLIEKMTWKTTGSLLDIGAGTGAFAHHMHRAGWRVTGLEPDASTRARAASLHGIELQDTSQLFAMNGQFDAITLWHVLEHVHLLHEYLDRIAQLLAPGGYAFIAVPNYTSQDAAHYGVHWAAYDVPRHLYHFSPAAMDTLVKKHELKVRLMQPMWYDAFYVSMLSEQYKNGKGNYPGAFLQGLASNWKAVFNRRRCSSLIYLVSAIS